MTTYTYPEIIKRFFPNTSNAPGDKDPDWNVTSGDGQDWYWSPWWQEMEREADQDLATGDYDEFDHMDDFIETLTD